MQGHRGQSTAEKQARSVIRSANDVMHRLTRRRQRAAQTPEDSLRAELRAKILADVERLSNLVTLMETASSQDLTAQTRARLHESLTALRRDTTQIGAEVALEQIEEIRRAARDYAAREHHPLGKAISLKEVFLRHVSYLSTLSGGIPEERLGQVEDAAVTINHLAARDRASPWLRSFREDDHEVVSDIDVDALTADRDT